MKSWVPDVAAQGGGGGRAGPRWRNCHGSTNESHLGRCKRVFTFPGAALGTGKAGWEGEPAWCCSWTFGTSSPGCPVSALEMTTLWKNLGALKTREGK